MIMGNRITLLGNVVTLTIFHGGLDSINSHEFNYHKIMEKVSLLSMHAIINKIFEFKEVDTKISGSDLVSFVFRGKTLKKHEQNLLVNVVNRRNETSHDILFGTSDNISLHQAKNRIWVVIKILEEELKL